MTFDFNHTQNLSFVRTISVKKSFCQKNIVTASSQEKWKNNWEI